MDREGGTEEVIGDSLVMLGLVTSFVEIPWEGRIIARKLGQIAVQLDCGYMCMCACVCTCACVGVCIDESNGTSLPQSSAMHILPFANYHLNCRVTAVMEEGVRILIAFFWQSIPVLVF